MKPKNRYVRFAEGLNPRIYVNEKPQGDGVVIELSESDMKRLSKSPPHTWYLHEGEILINPELAPIVQAKVFRPKVDAPVQVVAAPTFWQKNRAIIVATLVAVAVSVIVKLI